MAKLKVVLKSDRNQHSFDYKNEVNADNFKDIALVFSDLRNALHEGVFDKAIKQMSKPKSDWDLVLSMD
jgi:hypothetical protein